MPDEASPTPDEQQPTQRQPSYSEVPPSLQEYVSAMTGNDWIAEAAWALPTVDHPQGREAMA